MKTIEGGKKEEDLSILFCVPSEGRLLTADTLGESMALMLNAPLKANGGKPRFVWDKNNKKIVEIKLVPMEEE